MPGLRILGAGTHEAADLLRAVRTVDFMAANGSRQPCGFRDVVAHRIVNEVQGVSPVVYNISGKPSATIEWG